MKLTHLGDEAFYIIRNNLKVIDFFQTDASLIEDLSKKNETDKLLGHSPIASYILETDFQSDHNYTTSGSNGSFIYFFFFSPQTPVAQKIADEVIFRHFQGEGVEFF